MSEMKINEILFHVSFSWWDVDSDMSHDVRTTCWARTAAQSFEVAIARHGIGPHVATSFSVERGNSERTRVVDLDAQTVQ